MDKDEDENKGRTGREKKNQNEKTHNNGVWAHLSLWKFNVAIAVWKRLVCEHGAKVWVNGVGVFRPEACNTMVRGYDGTMAGVIDTNSAQSFSISLEYRMTATLGNCTGAGEWVDGWMGRWGGWGCLCLT